MDQFLLWKKRDWHLSKTFPLAHLVSAALFLFWSQMMLVAHFWSSQGILCFSHNHIHQTMENMKSSGMIVPMREACTLRRKRKLTSWQCQLCSQIVWVHPTTCLHVFPWCRSITKNVNKSRYWSKTSLFKLNQGQEALIYLVLNLFSTGCDKNSLELWSLGIRRIKINNIGPITLMMTRYLKIYPRFVIMELKGLRIYIKQKV